MIVCEILKQLDSISTLSCSLVCKEWLVLARSDLIWKNHLVRDFVEMKENHKLKIGSESYEKRINFLKNYDFNTESSPLFIEYWYLVLSLSSIK